MDDKFKNEIEKVLNENLDKKEKIISFTNVGGGCINSGSIIITESKKSYFVKYNEPYLIEMFKCESNGIKEIEKSNTIRVPYVIGVGGGQNKVSAFLIIENIESTGRKPGFYEDFGRRLAQMHKYTNKNFGFYENNYIGSTPQINTYSNNWVEFYRDNRLGYQIELAKKKGLATKNLIEGMENLMSRLDEFISDFGEAPSLLHGDLWGGNYMIGNNGEVVLIDPAVYYGNRETDLAMTEMFGGFSVSFYDAYKEEYPLESGYKDRSKIYKLYHYLNHLNLFGGGYLGSCLSIVQYFSK